MVEERLVSLSFSALIIKALSQTSSTLTHALLKTIAHRGGPSLWEIPGLRTLLEIAISGVPPHPKPQIIKGEEAGKFELASASEGLMASEVLLVVSEVSYRCLKIIRFSSK